MLAVTLRNWHAEVEVVPAPAVSVRPASALVEATLRRFARQYGGGPVLARWCSDIPREVGLGGSSALVIATARALCALHGVPLGPGELACFALAVEVEELGIVAGPQDRVTQAFGGLLYMDFAADRYEQLDSELLPPLFVAWRPGAGAPSGGLHRELRARFERGEPELAVAMGELHGIASNARTALLRGDRVLFARCVDASFDTRRRIISLDPRCVEMVELARSAGASANYAGSGGAIIGCCRDDGHREAVLAALTGGGCYAAAPLLDRTLPWSAGTATADRTQ